MMKQPFKTKFRRDPGSRPEAFSANTVDGVHLTGAIGTGYLNGAYVCLFEFEGAGEEYRWLFSDAIPEKHMELIKAGLRNDPAYRDQFRKPAVPAKEVDQVVLGDLLARAFGEHSIESTGSIEPGPHSWESRLRVVLADPIPATFATFVRKCSYLSLSKTLRQDCITVTPPLGNAHSANLLFIRALTDFAEGSLGSQADYKLKPEKFSTWPTKPEVISPPVTAKKKTFMVDPSVSFSDKIQLVINTSDADQKKRHLLFLKAGRDTFSTIKQEALEEMIAPEDVSAIHQRFKAAEDQSKALRWILRGLPLEDASLKVEIDNESKTKLVERKRDHNRYESDASRWGR